MTTQYINTNRDKTSSDYARVLPSFDGSTLTFTVKSAAPVVAGQVVPMVHAKLRVVTPAVVTSCNPAVCDSSVNEAITIDFNVKRGSDVTALKLEALRVLEVALSEYQLNNGVLPPATADFTSAKV